MSANEENDAPLPPAQPPSRRRNEERVAEDWESRLRKMVPGTWYNATDLWNVTRVDTRTINDVLYNRLRNKDNPDDPGHRIIAVRNKLTNRKKDAKGGWTDAEYELVVKLVTRGKMLELELDAEAEAERERGYGQG